MVNDFREQGFTKMGGVLSSKGIMNLEKDLDIGFVAVKVHIPAIDQASDCGLRDRGDGLLENGSLMSVEEPNAITEDVFDILVLADRAFNGFLPLSNFRELIFKIPGLDFLNTFG